VSFDSSEDRSASTLVTDPTRETTIASARGKHPTSCTSAFLQILQYILYADSSLEIYAFAKSLDLSFYERRCVVQMNYNDGIENL
jgi:hypothetical protein